MGKVSKVAVEDESKVEAGEEVTKDWIVVPTAEIDAAKRLNENRKPANSYDGQHPRNVFSRKMQPKRAKSTERQITDLGIDWSQEGVPTEVKKQILHASMTASHRGPYGQEQISSVPLNVLRTQNRSSSMKRQNSTPKTPRSQSKPRAIQQ